MSLSLRLDLRQTQGLVMTPQLQQAIKLLQLSNLELAAYVDQELETNPFLERQDGAEAADASPPAREPALSGEVAMNGHEPGDGWSGAAEEGWSPPADAGLPSGLGIDSLGQIGRGGRGDFDDDDTDVGGRLTRPKALREHLIEQLGIDLPAGPERLIGLHLIDHIDDVGFLRVEIAEIAARLGCPPAAVEHVLARLQQFDPPGVAARSVAECLALQLRERNRLDPAMQALLDHLDLLARADIPGLLKVCAVSAEDLADMIAELKALDPKPGLAFAHDPVQTLVPDIYVYRVADGAWRVELNSATLPRVLVNLDYHLELSRGLRDERARQYLAERLQSANWLVKALDQRARTVLRVAEAVVERQIAFLEQGVQHLRPLVLRDIAEATGLHESTISRATADKCVATPRGNVLFKYFFSNALPGTDREAAHAAEAIRQRVRTLVEHEEAEHVLSDDQIVRRLRAEGIVIARRTVAKYRESLAIPSSAQRRRTKALRLA